MTQKKIDVYHNLKYRIITQDLAPGLQLNERDLMAHYDIGRTPLREIFIELQRDGLINRFPRSGTFVTSMDLDQLKQFTEIRIPLEGLAGRLAAERATDGELAELKGVLEKADQLTVRAHWDMQALFECDTLFHNIIYEACHNPKLLTMLHELQSVGSRFWHYQKFARQEYLDQWQDHRKIRDALVQRDRDLAQETMQHHLLAFIAKLKSRLL